MLASHRRGIGRAYQLVCQHENCLDRKLAVAEIEKIFQAGPQEVQHHDIVFPFYAIPSDAGYAGCREQLPLQVVVV